VVTAQGLSALAMAREFKPAAITLDINLPDMDGWRILGRLKEDSATRHIPVHIISTDEERERGLRMGAVGVLTKPVKTKEVLDEAFKRLRDYADARPRAVVVAHGEKDKRESMEGLIGGPDINVVHAATGEEAAAALREHSPALMVVDLDLPGQSGLELIDAMRQDPAQRDIPVLIYSADKQLSKKIEAQVKRLTQVAAVKDIRSPERLLDEAALFLHRPLSTMSPERREMLDRLHATGTVLAGKKVLVVDDDIRNIFAMTSILERFNMQILSAETGKAAIDILGDNGDVDVVLMDIMMPMMDGYDTIRAIRRQARFRSLPIIAVTAKAMKGDREKCIEAGASDYISKPVDTEQLLGCLRLWLYR
jgi:CheY-like chemotaxis protein